MPAAPTASRASRSRQSSTPNNYRPSISSSAVRLRRDHAPYERGGSTMKYMLLIHQGEAPTPRDPEAWARLSEDEQKAVYADYQAINQTPGVTPGLGLDAPE